MLAEPKARIAAAGWAFARCIQYPPVTGRGTANPELVEGLVVEGLVVPVIKKPLRHALCARHLPIMGRYWIMPLVSN